MPFTSSNFTGTSEEDFRSWVKNEFSRLSKELSETVALDLRPVHREPIRPREGMIVYADGTDWNPGLGKGCYEYRGAAWFKL